MHAGDSLRLPVRSEQAGESDNLQSCSVTSKSPWLSSEPSRRPPWFDLGDANASASTGSARGWETLSQAQALIEARRGALFPQVSAAAAAGRQSTPAAFFGELKGPAPFTYYSIGPSVSYTLDYTKLAHLRLRLEGRNGGLYTRSKNS